MNLFNPLSSKCPLYWETQSLLCSLLLWDEELRCQETCSVLGPCCQRWGTKARGRGGWAVCPLSSVRCFFLSHDTGFLSVPSLIYPCQWAHRNRSMNCLNWHFKLSKLRNSDTPAEYSLPTLTTYSFIIPSKSPLFQVICLRRCNKCYFHV